MASPRTTRLRCRAAVRVAAAAPAGVVSPAATADIQLWAANTQPATLPAVPTNERLSFVDQFTGSGHRRIVGARRAWSVPQPEYRCPRDILPFSLRHL